jgi:hypothetical protein
MNPLIHERTYYLTDVAKALEITTTYVRMLVKKHQDLFDAPRYRRRGRNPRKHRVFSQREFALLHSFLLVNRKCAPARKS